MRTLTDECCGPVRLTGAPRQIRHSEIPNYRRPVDATLADAECPVCLLQYVAWLQIRRPLVDIGGRPGRPGATTGAGGRVEVEGDGTSTILSLSMRREPLVEIDSAWFDANTQTCRVFRSRPYYSRRMDGDDDVEWRVCGWWDDVECDEVLRARRLAAGRALLHLTDQNWVGSDDAVIAAMRNYFFEENRDLYNVIMLIESIIAPTGEGVLGARDTTPALFFSGRQVPVDLRTVVGVVEHALLAPPGMPVPGDIDDLARREVELPNRWTVVGWRR